MAHNWTKFWTKPANLIVEELYWFRINSPLLAEITVDRETLRGISENGGWWIEVACQVTRRPGNGCQHRSLKHSFNRMHLELCCPQRG